MCVDKKLSKLNLQKCKLIHSCLFKIFEGKSHQKEKHEHETFWLLTENNICHYSVLTWICHLNTWTFEKSFNLLHQFHIMPELFCFFLFTLWPLRHHVCVPTRLNLFICLSHKQTALTTLTLRMTSCYPWTTEETTVEQRIQYLYTCTMYFTTPGIITKTYWSAELGS